MNLRLLASATLMPILLGAHLSVSANVVTFQNAAAGAFTSYSEAGFTVSAVSGPWIVSNSFGNPAPFIQFTNTANSGPLSATTLITGAGVPFTFSSVELYSSITAIPYTVSGFLDSVQLFSFSGTVPNTFGGFAQVSNPQAALQIDSLTISLTNPALTCCSNPMGLDNIVLTPSAPVPEPSALILLLSGLGLMSRLKRIDA